jgi:hypothetical protein
MTMMLITLLLLILMEISLSFDNAVLNAKVLQTMPPVWQRRFLTWGILVAVFGMRLVFPILIVAVAADLSFSAVLDTALYQPEEYARNLTNAHVTIAAFGGFFLLMVFLKFMLDTAKEVHWFEFIEKHTSLAGKVEALEISIVLALMLGMQYFVDPTHRVEFVMAAISGVLIFVLVDGLMGVFSEETATATAATNGLMGFIYLEILDASCSLDGVIGAFVLTNNIVIIMIGLGVGAFAIRGLTVYLVRGGKLQEYVYLEHGAHYGIGALAIIMLTNIFYHVPEVITGLIGIGFIGLSIFSSIKVKAIA